MPAAHIIPVNTDTRVFLINKNGTEMTAHVMHKRPGEVYVHYLNMDKRMDEWVPEESCTIQEVEPKKKRRGRPPRRSAVGEPSTSNGVAVPSAPVQSEPPAADEPEANSGPTKVMVPEEEFDLRHRQQLNSQRNFDLVVFDGWRIKPWYYSPYPLVENEADEIPLTGSNHSMPKIPGVSRANVRSYGRTSDLLSGELQRYTTGETMLWVCDLCFKYMLDGTPWELHKYSCKLKHPPGKRVYQRGGHTIWEVDGAKEKLYCQNLSLFGKLFIDVKTLFFDCDNFLFYILTEGTSAVDHIRGFFSKEKLSFDGYNLACIMTLPQYQRQGYGMLLIEFSYELSRREGKVGSPERPLSDLGLRSYLAYWIATLVRFFRGVLSVLPPDVVKVKNASFPGLSDELSGDVERRQSKRRKRSKGLDSEVAETIIEQELCVTPLKAIPDLNRIFETTPRPDGGAETHVRVECTLEEIAKATNLRPDDAAFALSECGLLMRRLCDDDSEEKDVIVITRELVEKVAVERNVKIMYLDRSCILT